MEAGKSVYDVEGDGEDYGRFKDVQGLACACEKACKGVGGCLLEGLAMGVEGDVVGCGEKDVGQSALV